MKKLFLLASLLMAFGISADAGDITSPNGQIKVNFTLDGTVPTYSVTYQGKTIIKPSRLGYQLAKGGKEGKKLFVVGTKESVALTEKEKAVTDVKREEVYRQPLNLKQDKATKSSR